MFSPAAAAELTVVRSRQFASQDYRATTSNAQKRLTVALLQRVCCCVLLRLCVVRALLCCVRCCAACAAVLRALLCVGAYVGKVGETSSALEGL